DDVVQFFRSDSRRLAEGRNRPMIWSSSLARSASWRLLGRKVARIGLLGCLLIPLASSSANLVCTRGMAAAGPACPRCHGHLPTPLSNPCCKWIERDGAVSSAASSFARHDPDRLGLVMLAVLQLPQDASALRAADHGVFVGTGPPVR